MNESTDLTGYTFEDSNDISSSWSTITPRESSTLPRRRQQPCRQSYTSGSIVEPGKVIDRPERQRRLHSQTDIPAPQTPQNDEQSFDGLWQNIKQAAQPTLEKIDSELHLHLAPEAAIQQYDLDVDGILDLSRRSFPYRSWILTLTFFLFIYGSLHVVVSHLLDVSRASAQCSPLVSYIPVTYTVTSYVTPTISTTVPEATTTTVLSTSTSTHTVTIELSQVSVAPASAPATTGPIYSYVLQSGTTSWFNGVSPSSGQPLVTVTSTIYVSASSLDPATSTLDTATVSAPPYVSTSYVVPEQDSTLTLTTTRTSTTTLADVITQTRSSFTPIGSAGWNSTNAVEGTGFSTSSVSGVPTTTTGTIYWSTGTKITSTSFTTLTLTLTQSVKATTSLAVDPASSTHAASIETVPGQLPSTASVTSSSAVDPISSSLVSPVTTSTSQSYEIVPASYDGSLSSGSDSVVASPATASTSSAPYPTTLSTRASPSSSSGVVVGPQATSSGVRPQSVSLVPYSLPTSAGVTQSSIISPASMTSSSISNVLQSPVPTSSSTLPFSSLSTSFANSSTSQVFSILPATDSTSLVAQPLTTSLPSSSQPGVVSTVTGSLSSISNTTSGLAETASSSSAAVSVSVTSSSQTISPVSQTSSLSSSQSSVSSQTASVTTSSASSTVASTTPTPSVCGEHGNFTLTFDDLPSFSTNNNNTDITQGPPIFSGYHHFAFSNGYVYAPPPRDPFAPHSPPHLAVFLGNASGNGSSNTPGAMAPTSGMIRPGEFGDGDVDYVSAFWFNAYDTWIGCDNPGPEPCTYVITGYGWNDEAQQEQEVATERTTTSGCPGFENCQLQQIMFPADFNRLSGLQIQAYRGTDQVMFFMDDVSMGWYNNTCAAGLQRQRSQRGGTPSKR